LGFTTLAAFGWTALLEPVLTAFFALGLVTLAVFGLTAFTTFFFGGIFSLLEAQLERNQLSARFR
jgi:hypothetical protein